MALNYLTYQAYPLEIEGIDSQYNDKITAVENFVKSDMAVSGVTVTDAILSYFVYWFLCQDASSTVTIKTGETSPIAKTVYPSFDKQVQNWNLGVDKLRLLCGITEELMDEQRPFSFSSDYRIFSNDRNIMESIFDAAKITINMKYLSKRSLL